MDKEIDSPKTSKSLKKDLTKSTIEQTQIEDKINEIFKQYSFNIKDSENFKDTDDETEIKYLSHLHYEFAKNHMKAIPQGYESLDSGMPWFSYWVINILNMCEKGGYILSHNMKMKFVKYLSELRHEDGGFCGYPKGKPHIISNYAAVMAIIALGEVEGYELIDVEKMEKFLLSLKNNNLQKEDQINTKFDKKGNFLIDFSDKSNINSYQSSFPGSFQVHECGESDLRACYCAISVCSILDIDNPDIYKGVSENIAQCQTFEGGLGPEPFCEAHGGYSFCGIATLCLMGKLNVIDTDRFVHWLTNRQMSSEGGFQGRTNKLVDSCYSFWQGSVFNMLLNNDKSKFSINSEMLYDQCALQAYILLACQNHKGGLFDKPGKNPDLFHTNYASSGLILSQESLIKDLNISISYHESLEFEQMDPIFCVSKDLVNKARSYFLNKKDKLLSNK